MDKTPTCGCSNKTMDKSAGYASVLFQSSNGKEIEVCTKERIFVNHVAKSEICAKYVPSILSSVFRWRSEISDVGKMGSCCSIKSSYLKIMKISSRHLLRAHLQSSDSTQFKNSLFSFLRSKMNRERKGKEMKKKIE